MDDVPSSGSAEVVINENFQTLSHGAVYGKRPSTTSGLTWGYYGGRYSGVSVDAGELTLSNYAINYIVAPLAGGAPTLLADDTTNWDDTATYGRLYKVTTAAGVIIEDGVEDHRAGANGIGGSGGGGGGGTALTTKTIADDIDTYEVLADDKGKALIFMFPGEVTVTFPDTDDFSDGWSCIMMARGEDGTLQVETAGTEKIDGNNNVHINGLDGAQIFSDGSNFFTVRGIQPSKPSYIFIDRLVIGDETIPLTTGTNKFRYRQFGNQYFDGIRGSLSVAQGSGAQLVTVDMKVNGVSALSTLLTFDNGETTTVTATTPAAIADGTLPDDAEISFDVTVQPGSTAAGLKISLFELVQEY